MNSDSQRGKGGAQAKLKYNKVTKSFKCDSDNSEVFSFKEEI